MYCKTFKFWAWFILKISHEAAIGEIKYLQNCQVYSESNSESFNFHKIKCRSAKAGGIYNSWNKVSHKIKVFYSIGETKHWWLIEWE